jgi:O-antigen/teichoic acid export membrane protein
MTGHLYRVRNGSFARLRPGDQGLSLAGNAAWLAAARVAPMLTGFVFWALAALVLPPAQLGLGAAVVSAALLTVQLGQLGVGPATLTLLPSRPDDSRKLIATGLLTVSVAALAVAGGLVVITRAMGPGVGTAWSDPTVILAFLAAAVLAADAYQLDHIAVAQSRADRALVRSAAQGVVQLGTLVVWLVVGNRSLTAIVVAVAAGAAASLLLGGYQLRRSIRPDWRHGALLGEAAQLLRAGLPNHALVLADRAPGYLLPIVVAAVLSPTAAAAWYIVWMLATAVFFVPQSAGYSLQTSLAARAQTSRSTGQTDAIRALVRTALRVSLAVTTIAGVLLILAGPTILRLLGTAYATAWLLLPVLAPALIVSSVTQVYFGVCRAQGRLAEATSVAVLGGVIAVAPAPLVLAAGQGLVGLCALWLLAQLAAALIAGVRLWSLTHARSKRYRAAAVTADHTDVGRAR